MTIGVTELVLTYSHAGRQQRTGGSTKTVQGVWARVGQVLCGENVGPQIAAKFYKAVVQAVLLYGSETWNLTKLALARLEGFQVRVAYKMARKHSLGLFEDGGRSWRIRHGFHCRVHPGPSSDNRVVHGNQTNLYSLRWRRTAERVDVASVVVGASNVLGRNRGCNCI
jgi:hypothetical protein